MSDKENPRHEKDEKRRGNEEEGLKNCPNVFLEGERKGIDF